MKRILGLGVILFLIFGIVANYSFTRGVARKGHDKTGSPISSGKCFDCHSAGKFGVSLGIKLYDGDKEVQNYEPGHRYKLKLEVKHTGIPSKYGFEVVSLGSNSKDAGKFESIPSGFSLKKLNGVSYIDHNGPRNLQFLNVDWVAPDSDIGDVTIYFGGIAANGNRSTSGDGGAVNSLVIKSGTSSINDFSNIELDLFTILNNPTNNRLNIGDFAFNEFNINIISRDGKIEMTKHYENISFNKLALDISSLNNGLYYLNMVSYGKSLTKSFVVLN